MTVEMVTSATGTSLQRLAEASWGRTAEGTHVYFEDQHWTGTQLTERTRRLSGGLREAGLQPGERVVLCMANCPEVGISYQAIWRAGAVTTPVLFLLSEDELRHVLTDSGAVMAITTPEFLPKVLAAGAGVPALRAVVVAGDPGETAAAVPLLSFAGLEAAAEGSLIDSDPDALAALLYTGGTTGRSKGVMISHNALSAAAWATLATTYDPEANTILVPLPLSHAYGLLVNATQVHAIEPAPSSRRCCRCCCSSRSRITTCRH
jgi:long-chain acyl-CoA synthetase